MLININLKEDKELRNYIKDMIRGQVKSIARKEIKNIIEEVFREKYSDQMPNVDIIFRQEITDKVSAVISKSTGGWGSPTFLEKAINKEISKLIKNALTK